jgi:fatty acid desaturase
MHEGGHYSLTGNIKIDRMLQIVIYGVGCGMSGSWWRNQHNKHHATPQKLGHDGDLRTLPLVAFTSKVCKKLGLPMKIWIRLQAIMFPICTTLLVTLGWQFFLHPRHVLRTKNFSEAVCMIVRYVIWYHTISAKFGVGNGICKFILTMIFFYFNFFLIFNFYCLLIDMYLLYNWFAANYIFINFAVSHTHLPVVEKEDTTIDWVRYSAIYTMNVSPGPFKFINWWMSFLNFQIEHHLWPSVPQYRFPKISPRVKDLFEKHGLKYDQRSYTESIQVTFENLHNVGVDVFLG